STTSRLSTSTGSARLRRCVVRVDCRLSGVVRSGGVVCPKVGEVKARELRPATRDDPAPRLVGKPRATDLAGDLRLLASDDLHARDVEVRDEQAVGREPRRRALEGGELVAYVMKPMDAGDQFEPASWSPAEDRALLELHEREIGR